MSGTSLLDSIFSECAALTKPRSASSSSESLQLDVQPNVVLKELAKDLWTYEPSTWLKAYAPRADSWEDDFVEDIIESLKSGSSQNQDTPPLDDKGWVPIYTDLGANEPEDKVFSHLSSIISKITERAIALRSELRQHPPLTLKHSPCDENEDNPVAEWAFQSDWQGFQMSLSAAKTDGRSKSSTDIHSNGCGEIRKFSHASR